jgi:prevent-host-death family protein
VSTRVSAARAKAHFSELVARVAFGGERFVIERRGKPLAALVSATDLERVERGSLEAPAPLGALALVGGWGELGDADLDALVESIYAQRERDSGRPVDLDG